LILQDGYCDLASHLESLGFRFGIFVGMKIAGATKEELLKRGEGLIKSILAQPRFAERQEREARHHE
jgi:hypothetical protein